MTYRFDGSFEGFLCAVVSCMEIGEDQPDFVREGSEYDLGLFVGDILRIATVRSVAALFSASRHCRAA